MLIDTAISGVVGAVVAAAIAIAYQVKARKRALTLSLVDAYLRSAELRVRVQWIFDQWAEHKHDCLFPPDVADAPRRTQADRNYNKLIELGDQYELVAVLYRMNMLDNHLFDVSGLRSQASQFTNRLLLLEHPESPDFEQFWPNLYHLDRAPGRKR